MSNDFGNFPQNPYQPTDALPAPGLEQVKPTSMTVFGIINLVWGAMGLCGTVASAVQIFLVGSQPNMPNPMIEMMNESPVYRGFMAVSLFLGFLATIALIIGGVGLLKGKPYGRTLSIAYSIYTIVFGILGAIVSIIYLMMPLLQRADTMPDGPEKAGLIGGAIGGTVGGACGLIYPIVLLIFMMRAPIINYMRAQRL